MYRDENYWQKREDADTLKRAIEIQNDPERLRGAQQHIVENLKESAAVLGIPVPPAVPSRKNPATIMKLNGGK